MDHAHLQDMLSRIVGYETRLMGDAPFPEYLFLYHVGREFGGGGMEHSNGTAIGVGSASQLANVSAHEFFHLWNVKRIRPQSLEPVDYTREMWTPSLWFAEGVTNTYAAYTLVRSGVWNQGAVSLRPHRADQSTTVAPRTPLAERRGVQPRRLAREISALRRSGVQCLLLQQRTVARGRAGHRHSRRHGK